MAKDPRSSGEEREALPLSKAAEYLLDECRMVLPGIQALFGFQLIAVFSPGFAERLGPGEQRLHPLAIALVVLAIAGIMTPAALHRALGPMEVTSTFVYASTRLLLWSMVPLAVSLCADFYLISRVIVGSPAVAWAAAGLLALLALLWFVVPRVAALQRLIAGLD
jgi:hypothetical protein